MYLKTMGIRSDSATPGWHHTWASAPRAPWHTVPAPANWRAAAQVSSGLQCKDCFQGGRHTSQATAGFEVTHGPAGLPFKRQLRFVCLSAAGKHPLAPSWLTRWQYKFNKS